MSRNFIVPSVIEYNEKGSTHWDIYSKLLEQRIIFLNGEVEEQGTNIIVSELMYLDSINQDDITLMINSPGGCVVSGTQVIDVMNLIKSKVNTLVTGYACSMGAVILSAGTGTRKATENAQIMLHQISHGNSGNIQDTRVGNKHSEKLNKVLMNMLADNCGVSYKQLMRDTTRDLWLNAEEAIKYGVIDSIEIKGEK